MKVRMLRNPPRSLGCDLKEGETGNVPDGETLVKLGIAEPVLPEIKAVEPEVQAEVQAPKAKAFIRSKQESPTPTLEK